MDSFLSEVQMCECGRDISRARDCENSLCPHKKGTEMVPATQQETTELNATILDILDDAETGADHTSTEFTFVDIYKMLITNNDIILCIDTEELEPLKKGVSSVKYQVNKKAREKSERTDDRSIEYKILPDLDDPEQQPVGTIRVQLYLQAKRGLTVHKIIIPGGF